MNSIFRNQNIGFSSTTNYFHLHIFVQFSSTGSAHGVTSITPNKNAFLHSEKVVVRVFLPVMTNFEREIEKEDLFCAFCSDREEKM